MPSRPRGALVTFEGGEGGGKSTQAKALAKRLAAAGVAVIETREPGGTETAELIRAALLDGMFEKLGPKVEALLFAAARIDHLDVRIKPALRSGTWVISDRFSDSTRVYQGALEEVDSNFLTTLERVTLEGLRPDLTFILDVPARTGLSRAASRRKANMQPDRFERQSLRFHKGLRGAFLAIAKREPDRCVVVDATQLPEKVESTIWDNVARRLLSSVKSRA